MEGFTAQDCAIPARFDSQSEPLKKTSRAAIHKMENGQPVRLTPIIELNQSLISFVVSAPVA